MFQSLTDYEPISITALDGFRVYNNRCYYWNGFVFISVQIQTNGGSFASNASGSTTVDIATLDSKYYPYTSTTPLVCAWNGSSNGSFISGIYLQTNGNIRVVSYGSNTTSNMYISGVYYVGNIS